MIKKNHHVIDRDFRIKEVIQDFDRRHTGSEYNLKKKDANTVTAAELPVVRMNSTMICRKGRYKLT